MDLRFEDEDIAKTFSFASSPTEPDLMISFRDGVSAYKRRLQTVSPGDRIIMTQYGGGLRLNPRRPAILLAGGIGIAVFRSMIKEAIDTRVNTPLRLICLNQTEAFIYQEELEQWRESFPALSIYYHATKVQGRLDAKLLQKVAPDLEQQDIFIAGPPAMVFSANELALSLGVETRNIQTDIFTGY